MTVKTFGEVDRHSLRQLETCMQAGGAELGVLCADHHPGYSQPIGGAVAYEDHISPSGVGYDIGCGNKAVLTDLTYDGVRDSVPALMRQIVARISFGVGVAAQERADHPVLDEIREAPAGFQREMLDLAADQLGTVGGGNHYVDLFRDEQDRVWVGVHFGSRGFGHKTASRYFGAGGMDAPPELLPVGSGRAEEYIEAMTLAGRYAYAGRDVVVDKVLDILGARPLHEVHNHHNFAWREEHFGRTAWVVRKGCTPARPGQEGFVGASMGEDSVILEGVDGPEARESLYSTVHGAGRVMSRRQAKRQVDWGTVRRGLAERGIVLVGGGADEAPEAYKRLPDVLDAHAGSIRVKHVLKPLGVAMAGRDVFDPYRD